MKYLIIGAGIAGLYSAYCIHKKFNTNDIMIVEKNDRIGGRIYSGNIGDQIIEMGAGVILNIHTDVIKLVHELGLQDDLVLHENKRSYAQFITNDKNNYDIKNITNVAESGFTDVLSDLRNKIKNASIDINLVRSYSLFRLLER